MAKRFGRNQRRQLRQEVFNANEGQRYAEKHLAEEVAFRKEVQSALDEAHGGLYKLAEGTEIMQIPHDRVYEFDDTTRGKPREMIEREATLTLLHLPVDNVDAFYDKLSSRFASVIVGYRGIAWRLVDISVGSATHRLGRHSVSAMDEYLYTLRLQAVNVRARPVSNG